MTDSDKEPAPLAEVIVLGAASVGLIASLLPWYQSSVSVLGVTTSIEVNAWRGGAGAWLSMSGLMVAAGVVLVGGATATRKASPWCWPLVLGLSVFSALCLIAHWASWPRPGAGGGGHSAIEQRSSGLGELRPEASAGPGVGLYLGILATAVAAGASFLAVRAQRDTDGRTNREQSR